jgi:protein-S-isoprenylcysteine O-methyltransferase Ste14
MGLPAIRGIIMLTGLLAYYTALLAVIFAYPTWRLWKREGINALVLPSDDTAEGVIGIWFKGLIGAVALVVIASVSGVPSYLMGDLPWLNAAPLDVIGWILLGVSLLGMTVAQADMGQAWRIGIDHANTPTLARTGLFGWSRNPIFLGLRLNLIGLFLLLPNAATLTIMLTAEALIQVQVRLEEQHLKSVFGAAYIDYCSAVRRWL